MKITEEQVRYVADLANLRLTPEEVARMARDLESILGHIDKLNELDTSGVPAMAQVQFDAQAHSGASGGGQPLLCSDDWEETATLRADAGRAVLPNEIALANAPQPGGGFFKVPKVIER
jgi:aspartyl-tRNA(Asn)/glutamyl-tRNA(Gln) amidotransferase subunit C